MNSDNSRFNKILLIVFTIALVFGAYLFLGPKITSLINSYDQINEMNLSGTFRVYMFVQLISLGISFSILISNVVMIILGRVARKSIVHNNFVRYLSEYLSLLSVGGFIINISWIIFFIKQSYSKFIEKDHSKDSLLKAIVRFPLTLKAQYQIFFNDSRKYSYLKGMLSLLFWALLSLFLALIIRWQAGTNGCEYSWRGDTQNKSTIEAEAKFFGYPLRHFVKIPKDVDIDYLEFTKRRIEFRALSGTQRADDASFHTKYVDSKTCWRRFILGVLLFYAVFLRGVLALLFFILYKYADRTRVNRIDFVCDHGDKKTRRIESEKPVPVVEEKPGTIGSLDPYLLLAYGFGIQITDDNWQGIFCDEPKDIKTFGDVTDKGKGSAGSLDGIRSHFLYWLDKNGGIVSDMIILIDLCRSPIVDDLDFLSNEIFQKLPVLHHCLVFLSNGERLRIMSSNPNEVRERVEDWNEKFKNLHHAINEKRNTSFSIDIVDWFDINFRTFNSDLMLTNYLRKLFPDRFVKEQVSSDNRPSSPLFRQAMRIILNSFDRYVCERDKVDPSAGDSEDLFRQIFNYQFIKGKDRIDSLFIKGEDQMVLNKFIEGATDIGGNMLDQGKKVISRGKQIADDVKETLQGNPVFLGKFRERIIQKFKPQNTADKNTKYSDEIYDASREYASRLTERALTLSMQGMPLVKKVRLIDQMMSKFRSSSLLFEHDDVELALKQMADQIESNSF